ncbi:FMN-dependent dehydrogenase, includes L-lactate dehydrogenase and type II isopentenyl diphosphate isomerase [Oceanobacillus limi]|uniref:L-lactate oxidase n=1 Tax=Oceanobacillus limi TaxID=930131 RepID=A0A1H9Y8W5_9BACI|nr:lactate 2-monooxygenase [Oceanobacillus limi]SES65375.1 FMN-dependent dehydrogenase, includes L-lactate dehydrogenase and type II isopentenyl diphosphate isomerase [Oceanobacillus limi]
MKNIGNKIQYQIYSTMSNPDPNRLPVSYEAWEEKARDVLEDGPYYYVAGGAGGENTMKANLDAFQQQKIIPRMLRNVEERDLSIELFGQTYPSPVLQAPIGVQSIIHPEGEIASAKASAEMGVPYIASSASSVPMEKIAEEMGDAPRWFQLYWSKDPDITASFVRRAEQSGYSAIVVTLDTPMMAWREDDLKNVYLPFLIGEGVGNYFSDPAFLSKLEKSPKEDPNAAIMYWTQIFGNPGLTWDDIAFLREHTNLPILLKGILHPEDAILALEYGVDGIIVSNHGGRQVDGAQGALDALPRVCEAIHDQIPVLMDSGIRRGSDVIKALALGAKGVLVGRPCMYGLAVAGQQGVKEVLQNLIADLDITLGLTGHQAVSEIDRSALCEVKAEVEQMK